MENLEAIMTSRAWEQFERRGERASSEDRSEETPAELARRTRE